MLIRRRDLNFVRNVYNKIMASIFNQNTFAHTLTILNKEINNLFIGNVPINDLLIVRRRVNGNLSEYIAVEPNRFIVIENYQGEPINNHHYIINLLHLISELFRTAYPTQVYAGQELYYDNHVCIRLIKC